MLREEPFMNALFINIILGALWHYAMLFLCVSINTETFDENLKIYRARKWEREGKIYNDVLKINKWKDLLPQHIGKDGFAKDHIDDVSVDYLDEFIMETCRGEWNHRMNCMFFFVFFLINNLTMAILMTAVLWVGNIPFLVIQRYNRFRLQKLRKAVIKRTEREEKKRQNLSEETEEYIPVLE